MEASMNPKASIGIQNFEKLRKYRAFYVDKTNFIREWWENPDEVTLITRPRRFGKTLNLSMMECFFSTEFAGRGDLFEDLSVWKHEKYWQLQGTYPVIFVSFAGVKGSGVMAKRFWYDGFTFGRRSDIFNPWSITKFPDSGEYGPHWADTSSNRLVSELIMGGTAQIKMDTEALLDSHVSQHDLQVVSGGPYILQQF